jgi:hypothetical protein
MHKVMRVATIALHSSGGTQTELSFHDVIDLVKPPFPCSLLQCSRVPSPKFTENNEAENAKSIINNIVFNHAVVPRRQKTFSLQDWNNCCCIRNMIFMVGRQVRMNVVAQKCI